MSKMEPNADLRVTANFMRQMYVALTDEGFTAKEALDLVATALTTAMQQNAG